MSNADRTIFEFASWNSFQDFAERVRHGRRYLWDAEVRAFLDAVLATRTGRDVAIPEGSVFFRAQPGIDWRQCHDEDGNATHEEPLGYGRERMKARPNRAIEGRANPAGISVLYLSTTDQTAISEVRPWIGAEVSLAQLRTRRPLKAIDLSKGHGRFAMGEITIRQLIGKQEVDAETKTKAVWVDIDNAFSRPVTLSDDAADYVPTQILAELFRGAGYDAVIYKSQFGEKGFNMGLFDPNDAEVINCAPCQVKAVNIEFEEIGNRWFKSGD